MKIAYSIESIGNSGGIERVLSTKANYFAEKLGYEIHIIVGTNKPDNLFYSFSTKIHFHFLSIDFSPQKPWNIFYQAKSDKLYCLKVTQCLEQIKPDITISTFGREANFLYQLKDGSVKVLEFHFTKNYLNHLVNSLSKDKFWFFRKVWVNFLLYKEELLARKYDHIVLLTKKDKQLWGGNSKFKVIPNPLSFVSEKKSSLDSKTIVSMGRLVIPKGFQDLIKAFALLVKDFPEWTLNIYGEGQDKEYLKELINELSLQNSVFIHPPTVEVECVMLNASQFVLPSYYEGFGLVLTEAMTCGVPCVAYDCECGPGEIISDGEDGFLVRIHDINDLADKMGKLISDKTFRQKMGELSKQHVLRYEDHKIMKCWSSFFVEIIE